MLVDFPGSLVRMSSELADIRVCAPDAAQEYQTVQTDRDDDRDIGQGVAALESLDCSRECVRILVLLLAYAEQLVFQGLIIKLRCPKAGPSMSHQLRKLGFRANGVGAHGFELRAAVYERGEIVCQCPHRDRG